MIQTQNIIQDTSSTLLIGANDTLANLSRIVTALPGVKVPTYIYAVTPLRFVANATDAHLEIHGFFPDVSKDHPVQVRMNDGKPIALDRYVNNTLAFDLPSGSLSKEDSFVTMTFDLPEKHLLGTYYSSVSVKARIYVARTKPFTFTVNVNVGNPDEWATVTAKNPLIERADSSHQSDIKSFTAAQVFSTLVSNNIDYDMSTAEFVDFNHFEISTPEFMPPISIGPVHIPGIPSRTIEFRSDPIDQGSNPCSSGCTSSSGTWSWDSRNLSISLSAPVCDRGPLECGGGTHADFKAFPTFRVRRRNAQITDEVQALSKTLDLAHNKVSDPIVLPNQWTSIDIKGELKDDKKSLEHHDRLTSGEGGIRSANDAVFWKAEISGQSLIISTR
jgi:hypothetical protein